MYNLFWADWYLPAALPAIEKLFFSRLAPKARILDVCCGSGHVTQELVRRGYHVTGVDASAALIGIARRKMRGVDFRVEAVERLSIDETFDAALSTFDSMNHLLSYEDVRRAFAGIYKALVPGGLFVFDMNLEEAYLLDLTQWEVTVNDNAVGLVRGRYDPATKKATTELMWFTRQGDTETWTRRTSVIEQRCYPVGEIVVALQEAGFRSIETITASQAGMQNDLAIGRTFFAALR